MESVDCRFYVILLLFTSTLSYFLLDLLYLFQIIDSNYFLAIPLILSLPVLIILFIVGYHKDEKISHWAQVVRLFAIIFFFFAWMSMVTYISFNFLEAKCGAAILSFIALILNIISYDEIFVQHYDGTRGTDGDTAREKMGATTMENSKIINIHPIAIAIFNNIAIQGSFGITIAIFVSISNGTSQIGLELIGLGFFLVAIVGWAICVIFQSILRN